MAKLEKPKHNEYCATVVEIKNVEPIEGKDRIQTATFFGYNAIVSKDSGVGTIGIMFPSETQLSEEYCKNNNLYRDSTKNLDQDKKGYIEDNRRVKAIKFAGVRSDCLFMPLSSIGYTGYDYESLNVGDQFDMVGKHEVCKKYTKPKRQTSRSKKLLEKKESRTDKKYIPEHIDTDNYFRAAHTIRRNERIVVTQKLHGTSVRIANTYVKRTPSLVDKIARFFGAKIEEYEYDYIYGSRRVIKDPNKEQQHYYGTDVWVEASNALNGLLPKGFVVYGEIIGWKEKGSPLMKNYTYNLHEGTKELYVYRVAHVNIDGVLVDLSWSQVKNFCNAVGVKHVPEIWVGRHDNFNAEDFLDKKYSEDINVNCVPLSEGSPCDEGVCVRVEGIVPKIYKAKSPMFLAHESAMNDEGAEDIEEDQKSDDEVVLE